MRPARPQETIDEGTRKAALSIKDNFSRSAQHSADTLRRRLRKVAADADAAATKQQAPMMRDLELQYEGSNANRGDIDAEIAEVVESTQVMADD